MITREQFRADVFKRDNNKCVICGEPSQDAHHIIERRLWDESGGYYMDNGASLCGDCHIKAEQTIISCKEIREALGIESVCLPPHFYKDVEYDKWGNIILPDGRRLKGELFFDESVQKILKSGGVLDLFCKYVKYPRTYHLPWSEGFTKYDRILESTKQFEGKKVIVSVKMDGENTTFYNDYVHARSLDSSSHPSQSWVRNLHSKIAYNIPDGWRLCGENLFAQHTIKYNSLSSFFYVFSIWNEKNICLDWNLTCEWIELLGLEPVRVYYLGEWNKEAIKKLYQPEYIGEKCEGYVVRLASSFPYGEYRHSVAKFVAEEFGNQLKEGSGHWRHKEIIQNKLADMKE